ncbi:MAG: hypothetical protein OHK005_04980 [Candidatus Methylacidiphilales bacterium]
MRIKLLSLLTAATALALPVSSWSQSIYTSGHGDIGVGYDSITQEFEPHWHLEVGAVVDGNPLAADTEYEPANLIARTSSTRTSPTGLNSILGVADGSTIYAMGSATYQPNLGFGAEELNPVDWIGNITVTLTSWTIPLVAEAALYTTNIAGTTVVDRIFSTYAPGATDSGNTFTIVPGDHLHFQWAFTHIGTYDFTLTWSGTHVSDGLITTSATYTMDVIPEPSTYALLLLGLGVLTWIRFRPVRA